MRRREFWTWVDCREDDCWQWLKSCNKQGYGNVHFSARKVGEKSTIKYAHRVAYEYKKGPIPKGMHVLHSCDRPDCCNPDHLRVGTHDQNMKDKVKRARTTKGRIFHSYGVHKLTDNQVREVRKLLADGYTVNRLTKVFNVSYSSLSLIKHGKTYRDVV